MRYLLLALLTTCLLPLGASAFPNHGNPGGHFGLPTESAAVREDCTNATEQPCFETVQAAIDYVEGVAAADNRFVYIYPGDYTEDVDCDKTDGGSTTLVGLGGGANPQSGAPSLPRIVGCSAAERAALGSPPCGDADIEDTVHMAYCNIEKLNIEQGPDAGDTAIQTLDGAIIGVAATVGVVITDSVIAVNQTSGGLGLGEHLISLEHTGGSFFLMGSRVSCICSVLADAVCDNDTACIYMDNTGWAGPGFSEFMRNEMAFPAIGPPGAAEYAFMEMVVGPNQTLFADNVIYTEAGPLLHNRMFEIADTVAEVPSLIIHGNTYAGGVTTTSNQAAFMTVIGGGTTANVILGDIDNPEAFVLPSVWGGVMPNWMGNCDHPFYAEFDPDPTKLVGTPEYVSIYDSSVGAEAAVDQYITPTAVIPHKLNVLLNVGPGAGDTWTVRLNDDTATTGLTCGVTGANTTCTSAKSIASPVARGSKLDLMVYCNAGNCANDATSMIVTGCLGDIPQ